MKEQKLVITGMGAVTPIGIGVDAYWSALVEGQCGVGKITRFDASELPVQIAAELKDFDPATYMPKTLARTMDPFMQFAFVAAEEALKNSELSIESESDRIGIVMGTAMDGVTTVAQTQAAFDTGKRVGPRFVPMTIGNIAAAQISIAHGIHGPSLTLNTACSAGGDAIMTAAMLLRSGEADAVLAVGGESILCPIVVSGLSQAKALSRRNDDPEQACRPFDLDRDGFVIGEGGGALLIETEEHALARGAKIHAVLAGYANTSDAHHVTAPCPDGEGASRCMKLALKRAGMQPSDIGYINAHGTSTPLGDKAETLAVKAVFGGRELYFTEHGNFDILDYKYAQQQGWIPEDYRVFWGYEDKRLFQFAKDRLLELADGESPFNLTLLTVDTHFEDGYKCELCPDTFGDDQYSNVMACSSRQIADFISWIQQQSFYENTTIVLSGDHPTMDVDFCEDVDEDYTRKVYTAYINPAVEKEVSDRRNFTTFDNLQTCHE